MNHSTMCPRHLPLLLAIVLAACSEDDDDASDDANDDAGSASAGSEGSDSASGAPGSGNDANDTAADPDDSGGVDDPAVGDVPQICVDFVAHLLECDPSQAEFKADAEAQCAADLATYPDTAGCQAAVDGFFACASEMPCDMPDACFDLALALAGACQ